MAGIEPMATILAETLVAVPMALWNTRTGSGKELTSSGSHAGRVGVECSRAPLVSGRGPLTDER